MQKHTPTIRLMKILESLGTYGPQTIDEIVEHTAIPYTTVYRILLTLLHHDFMCLNEEKKYSLSLKLLNSISSNMDSFKGLIQTSHPHLQKLNFKTTEAVHLGILSGTRVLYIDKIESRHLLRMHSFVGYQAAVHCTALGKVLLAWQDESVVTTLLSTIELNRYTKKTISDEKKFLAHLREVRKNGYAVDDEEIEAHLYCFATPIFDSRNQVVAAVSISMPTMRVTKKLHDSFIKHLWTCTKDISKKLGNSDYKACLRS